MERAGRAACRLALDLTVHRVWGRAIGPHAQRVTLLGEDAAGEFCLLELGPGQAAAAGWEDLLAGRLDQVVGALARLWGSLVLGERHTTGNNQARLLRVMRGVRPTYQRVLYSLAVAGGGLQLLGNPVPPTADCRTLHRPGPGTRGPGALIVVGPCVVITNYFRFNVPCVVLHLEKGEQGVLYLQVGGRI